MEARNYERQYRSYLRETRTILLVDDSTNGRRSTRLMLEALGYNVIEATEGDAGLDFFYEQPGEIHGVVVDLYVKNQGGWHLANEIRKTDQNLPIILTCASMSPQSMEQLEQVVNSWLLKKPFLLSDLENALFELIDD